MKGNRWELYSSKPGWKAASAKVDTAVAKAVRLMLKGGASAESAHASTVRPVLYSLSAFGAADSEGLYKTLAVLTAVEREAR
jgi:hypothetical protein